LVVQPRSPTLATWDIRGCSAAVDRACERYRSSQTRDRPEPSICKTYWLTAIRLSWRPATAGGMDHCRITTMLTANWSQDAAKSQHLEPHNPARSRVGHGRVWLGFPPAPTTLLCVSPWRIGSLDGSDPAVGPGPV